MSPRFDTPILAGATAVSLLVGAAVLGAGPARGASASPPSTVHAAPIAVTTGTSRPGARIPGSQVATPRTDLAGGVELAFGADRAQGATYPVLTTDGGRVWRTDGPALEIDAAQAPLTVQSLGAESRRIQYAYGGGQVVDVTSDGGAVWSRALFQGLVMAVVPNLEHTALVAFVDVSQGSHGNGPTLQYVSSDGGRTWARSTRQGG